MSRMDELIETGFVIEQYRDLPEAFQLAIAHYMAVDGCSWDSDPLGDAYGKEAAKKALVAALPYYVSEYGDTKWGVAHIPAERMRASVMADEEIASSFSSWEEYSDWFKTNSKMPSHGPRDRWPSILSSYDDETLQDGWHRMHSYLAASHADVPVVFFAEMRHLRAKIGACKP